QEEALSASRCEPSYRGLAPGGFAAILHGLQHADDAVVTEALEILDRPALGLLGRPVHHALDQLLRQLRRLVVGPGQIERGAELLQHVARAALAAGAVVTV